MMHSLSPVDLRGRRARRGLTLTELLVASTIMVMIVGGMSMLAMSVHSANDHCQGQSTAAQHGRVTLDRIARAVHAATASEQFPGCQVVTTQVGAWVFPDTLFVWLPEATPVDAAGLPRVGELVLFTPDSLEPNCLLEIRLPGSSTIVPATSNTSAWRTLADSLRSNAAAERTVLTDRLRTGVVASNLRGCVRFNRLLAPTEADWLDYREGDLDWDEIDWPLDAYSSTAGIRRVVCHAELQIVPSNSVEAAGRSVPFFGSAAVTYDLSR